MRQNATKGGKMKATQVLKRDNLLVEFIKAHKGRNQAVSTKEITEYLGSKGYKTPITSLLPIIRKIMYERNLPICFVSMGGVLLGREQSRYYTRYQRLANTH